MFGQFCLVEDDESVALSLQLLNLRIGQEQAADNVLHSLFFFCMLFTFFVFHFFNRNFLFVITCGILRRW